MITVIPNSQPDRPTGGGAITPNAAPFREYRLNSPAKPKPAKRKGADAANPKVTLPNCGGISKEEMARICQAANEAYKHLVETGRMDVEFPDAMPAYKRMEAWRRTVTKERWGLDSLTMASHQQFNEIRAFFDSIAPQRAGRAYRGLVRGDGDENKKRIALFKIEDACRAGNLSFPYYPLSIAAKQFRVASLDKLTAKQAWALFYTMTGRSRAHQKKPKINPTPPDFGDDPF